MDLDLYNIPELNEKGVTVLYAAPEFYTDFGKACKIGAYYKEKGIVDIAKDERELFIAACSVDYNIFSTELFEKGNKLVYICDIANDSVLMRGLKVLTCETAKEIFEAIGFDVFAVYANRNNLCFIGYHNSSDKLLSMGYIRLLREPYTAMSEIVLSDKYTTTTDVSQFRARTSLTLLPYMSKR